MSFTKTLSFRMAYTVSCCIGLDHVKEIWKEIGLVCPPNEHDPETGIKVGEKVI